jgi:hypothetical protein
MTATATIYTPFGFAIAADGRQLWENEPTRDDYVRQGESDNVQKIFGHVGRNFDLAYIARGHIANRDRSFDLGQELENLFGTRNDSDVGLRLQKVSANLQNYIVGAKRQHKVDQYPDTYVDIIGYAQRNPFWFEMHFSPYINPMSGSLYQLTSREFWPGFCIVSGSLRIRDLIGAGHPDFFRFCQSFDYNRSLEDAAGFVKGYIEACCCPQAIRFDSECEGLGGHIHVATIDLEHGFKWVVEPIPSDA